jgi:tripartite-type tricarboxylate transporter receptor subunit TctC
LFGRAVGLCPERDRRRFGFESRHSDHSSFQLFYLAQVLETLAALCLYPFLCLDFLTKTNLGGVAVKTISKVLFLAMGAMASLSLPAIAQEWPNRPVRVIVPFGAGGSGDILARLVSEQLSASLKQQFVVENRTGAGGALGVQALAAAEPNGYTIGITNLSTLSLAPLINPSVTYDPIKSLSHIAYVGGAPVLLSAALKTNVRTLPEFIAHAKDKAFTFASSGVGSDGHLMGQAIAMSMGVKVEHVPYTQTAQALGDLVAGHIPFTTFTLSSSAPFQRAKQINGIAVTTAERLPDFPDVPTFKELGYPNLVGTTWFSMSGPANLPKEIVEKLNREIIAAVSKPSMQEVFRRDGFIAQPMSAADFTTFVAQETARWKPVVEAAGLLAKK